METTSFAARPPAEHSAALAGAAVGFNHRGRAAESSNDLCGALLAIASHDLRQPLQVIIGAHDILAKTLKSGVEKVQLARVEDAASRLNDKLDQLVDALRLFEPASGGRQETVELAAVFDQAEAEFAEPAPLKVIELRLIPPPRPLSSNPA